MKSILRPLIAASFAVNAAVPPSEAFGVAILNDTSEPMRKYRQIVEQESAAILHAVPAQTRVVVLNFDTRARRVFVGRAEPGDRAAALQVVNRTAYVGRDTDFGAAFQDTRRELAPLSSGRWVVVGISDCRHDPPSGSRFAGKKLTAILDDPSLVPGEMSVHLRCVEPSVAPRSSRMNVFVHTKLPAYEAILFPLPPPDFRPVPARLNTENAMLATFVALVALGFGWMARRAYLKQLARGTPVRERQPATERRVKKIYTVVIGTARHTLDESVPTRRLGGVGSQIPLSGVRGVFELVYAGSYVELKNISAETLQLGARTVRKGESIPIPEPAGQISAGQHRVTVTRQHAMAAAANNKE